MRLLKRRSSTPPAGDVPAKATMHDSFPGSDEELREEIARLAEANRDEGDRDRERRLLRLRHIDGIRRLGAARAAGRHPEPDTEALPATGLPEIAAEDVTPGLMRAGILRDGCLLVRGLVPRDTALAFAQLIDDCFAERAKLDDSGTPADGYYEEFRPEAQYSPFVARDWIRDGGGVLAADSPLLSFHMLELFREGGIPEIVEGYLGEPAVISMHKTTLRKASPSVPGAWHQDGTFMGEVRALNLWLSLSRCGDVAPGLDVVPRRLEHLVKTQTEEAMLPIQASQAKVEEAAGTATILRPIFEPGDALFFDELFMHQTASDPSMPNPRFAIESWFFGISGFPEEYAPVAAR
jgi:hypothetical protein